MSKLSVHVTSPGSVSGFGAFLQKCFDADSPVGVVYALNIDIGPDIYLHSPATKWIYRRQSDAFPRLPDGMFTGDPAANATNWLTGIQDPNDQNRTQIQNWKLNQADWFDPLNEPVADTPAKAAWLNTWMLTALDIANSNGFKLALFSFPTGFSKDPLIWNELVPALRRGLQLGAVLSLHAYWEGDPSLDHDNALRYRDIYKLLPIDAQLPIVISEASSGNGYDTGLSGQGWIDDMAKYDGELMKDSYVLGACGFQLGGQESNLVGALPAYGDYIAKTPTPIVTPPPPPVSNYLSIIYLAPQVLSKAEAIEFDSVRDAARGTATQSADDAVTINQSAAVSPDSKIVVFKPSGWTASIDAWLKGKGVKNIEYREFHSLVVPWLSQLSSTASYAPGDCGAADVAMLVNYRGQVVTVDDVSKASGAPAGYLTLNSTQLIKAAGAFGVPLEFLTNQSLSIFQNILTNKQPMLALVNYAALPNRVKRDPLYSRGHWLLVVGITADSVIYHDPYEIDQAIGAYKTITQAEFLHAWSAINYDFSIPNQVLRVMTVSTPPPPPTPPPASTAWRGLHMRADGHSTDLDFTALTVAGCTAAKIMTNTGFDELDALKVLVPVKNIVLRLFAAGDNPALGNAAQFFDQQRLWIDYFAKAGGLYVEVHNEPNLSQEGYGTFWNNGAAFGGFFAQVSDLIHVNFPSLKVGYPGLSPNTANEGEFMTSLKALISIGKVDWIGAHSYWVNAADMNVTDNGRHYRRFLNMGKPVLITEFSNVGSTDSDQAKGQQYKSYYASLEAGVIGAYCFVSSASDPTFASQCWVRNNALTAIPAAIGS